MKRYNPNEIEPKWQKIWDETNVYTANLNSDKPKYIGMSMFNYPSGAGIHIGHAMNYTISDVKARFKRQQGYESYHPVGWDAFGLPAENYAIKAGVSPQESMATIIPSYHTQYKAMGWSNDWEKEIATHTPEYYKWTQWIFSQMYKHNLAYQDARMQWWCTKCQTVLANEQVIDGKCWRHDGLDDPIVEKKEVKQWFFKITEYADELLEATDNLDWTESVKLAQKNWIGRSVGAEINFAVCHPDLDSGSSQSEIPDQVRNDTKASDEILTVFTTRADTLFGATFLVLAPEHELVAKIVSQDQKTEVDEYIKAAAKKTEVERQAAKEKTGVFTGAYAVNPINNEKTPIWIADYVLAGYGTGAIMAVPAHDERDFEFAKKFDLPIKQVIMPCEDDSKNPPQAGFEEVVRDTVIVHLKDLSTGKFALLNWHGTLEGITTAIMGGIEDGQTAEEAARMEIEEEAGLTGIEVVKKLSWVTAATYCASHKKQNRKAIAQVLLAEINNLEGQVIVAESEQANHSLVWVNEDEVLGELVPDHQKMVWQQLQQETVLGGEGEMINSGKYDGLSSSEAREKIVDDLKKIELEPTFTKTDGIDAVKPELPSGEREAITAIVKHWSEDKYLGLKWKKVDWDTFLTGGVEDGQTPEEAAIAEIREETGYLTPKLVKNLGKNHAKFFHVPKNENRHAHFSCFYFELQDDSREQTTDDEQSKHDVVWLTPKEVETFRLPDSHRFLWNKLNDSEPTAYAAREVTNYKMRDWSVSRQRYWGAPIPIVNCEKCGTVLVPDKDLPVVLPELTDFQPSGDGRSALARAKDWLSVDCPDCGGPAERETDTLDTYICSSWYMFRYMDPHNQEKIFDSKVINKWTPIDFYNGGDHATAHMLYARFVTRFFNKIGLVDNPEPFKQFLFNGKVTASDGSAFSKSKGNGIDPLEIINSGYGADALRTYLMFAAPLEFTARWDAQGVPGTHRFLSRLWNLVQEYNELPEQAVESDDAPLRATHRMIKKVTEDLEANRYNTAIAASMECLNTLYSLKSDSLVKNVAWQQALEQIVSCVAPFAPHIADELWNQLGHSSSIHKDSWPKWDDKYLISDTVKIVVQVNGKVRATVEASAGADESAVSELALANEKVASQLQGNSVKKTIYIQNKLINFVI